MSPLVYGDTAALLGATSARFCSALALDPEKVVGNIVVCDRGNLSTLLQGYNVLNAGGVGMILREIQSSGLPLLEYHLLPAIHVDSEAGSRLVKYIEEDSNPTASISDMIQTFGSPPLDPPEVMYFSSRGPNPQTDILKPDIVAPGYQILASWTQNPRANGTRVAPTLKSSQDPRTTEFAIISGTSMACPHVSGTIALLKGVHPDWSPGALYSAVLTTAASMPETPFQAGHGLLNPNDAADPGLVYDSRDDDYAVYLCQYGYQLETSEKVYDCDISSRSYDFNSPSVMMSNISSTEQRTTRRVTNKGPVAINYTVSIGQPLGALVTISPNFLYFTAVDQELNFTITIVGLNNTISEASDYSFGQYVWTSGDGKYIVRSPIVVSVTGLDTSVLVSNTSKVAAPPFYPITDKTPLVRAPPSLNSTPFSGSILSPPRLYIPVQNITVPPAPSSSQPPLQRLPNSLLRKLQIGIWSVLFFSLL